MKKLLSFLLLLASMASHGQQFNVRDTTGGNNKLLTFEGNHIQASVSRLNNFHSFQVTPVGAQLFSSASATSGANVGTSHLNGIPVTYISVSSGRTSSIYAYSDRIQLTSDRFIFQGAMTLKSRAEPPTPTGTDVVMWNDNGTLRWKNSSGAVKPF